MFLCLLTQKKFSSEIWDIGLRVNMVCVCIALDHKNVKEMFFTKYVYKFSWYGISLVTFFSISSHLEGEIRERAVSGRCVIGLLARIMRGKNISMDIKRRLRNSIFLPTLLYGLEAWAWNRTHQSRVRAVEMNYLKGTWGVTKCNCYWSFKSLIPWQWLPEV